MGKAIDRFIEWARKRGCPVEGDEPWAKAFRRGYQEAGREFVRRAEKERDDDLKKKR